MLENASSRKPPRCRCYPRGATRQQKCPRSESEPALRRRRRELRRCRHGPVRGRQGWIPTDPGAQVKLSRGGSAPRREGSSDLSEKPGRSAPLVVPCCPREPGVPLAIACGLLASAHRSPGAPESWRTGFPAYRTRHGNCGRPLVPESRRTGVPAHRGHHTNGGRQCTGVSAHHCHSATGRCQYIMIPTYRCPDASESPLAEQPADPTGIRPHRRALSDFGDCRGGLTERSRYPPFSRQANVGLSCKPRKQAERPDRDALRSAGDCQIQALVGWLTRRRVSTSMTRSCLFVSA